MERLAPVTILTDRAITIADEKQAFLRKVCEDYDTGCNFCWLSYEKVIAVFNLGDYDDIFDCEEIPQWFKRWIEQDFTATNGMTDGFEFVIGGN